MICGSLLMAMLAEQEAIVVAMLAHRYMVLELLVTLKEQAVPHCLIAFLRTMLTPKWQCLAECL
ncbi:hypothetical protein M674_03575 [Neisseria gonorrhoeae SK708]|nr:hypothetical protein M674_03575 [Neisseria gonorrhoeae SK708]